MIQLRPVALLLCGPSLAGKSTLAGRLRPHFDAVTISADAINVERGLPFGAEGLPESAWAETLRIELERIEQAGHARRSVVLDDTCCYRWLRDRLRSTCLAAGLLPILLVLRPKLSELHVRHSAALASSCRPVLSLANLDHHIASFEWPAEDEDQVEVGTRSIQQVLEAVRSRQQNPA